MTESTQHLSEALLEEYHFRRLQPDEEEKAEDHLFWCDSCRLNLQKTQEFVATMQCAALEVSHRGADSRPARSSFWSFRMAVPALACLTLVVVLGHVPQTQKPEEIRLSVSRGSENRNLVRQNSLASLGIDLEGIAPSPSFRVEVVTSTGRAVLDTTTNPESGRVRVDLPRSLSAGQYWVRLYSKPGGELEQEYSLTVQP